MKKKHPFYSGLQPLQGFVPQNPVKDQSGLFSSPHERSYSFASGGKKVEASVFPSPLVTSNVFEQQTIAFALDLGANAVLELTFASLSSSHRRRQCVPAPSRDECVA